MGNCFKHKNHPQFIGSGMTPTQAIAELEKSMIEGLCKNICFRPDREPGCYVTYYDKDWHTVLVSFIKNQDNGYTAQI
jgi:hypothetical protein